MKKYNFLIYIVCILCLLSCSLDDKLEPATSPNVSVLEESDRPLVRVGDTVSFKIIASTNEKLKQIIVSDKSHDFETLPEGITLELVEDCTIDSLGYLSRPVSTVIVNYPIVVPDVVGEEVSMRFVVIGENGEQTSVESKFFTTAFVDNSLPKVVFPFYWYKAASHDSAMSSEWANETTDLSMFIFSTDYVNYTLYGPQNEILSQYILGYDSSIMGETKFIKIDDSLEYDDFYDAELEALDFTVFETHMDIAVGETLGFQLFNGRKGILKLKDLQYGFYPRFISRIERAIDTDSEE